MPRSGSSRSPAATATGRSSSPASSRSHGCAGSTPTRVRWPRRIPYPDDHFDLVAVLDARPAARELARVLRPGGHLILAATQGSPTGGGPLGRLLKRGLRSRGFEEIAAQRAGTGAFRVARLAGS